MTALQNRRWLVAILLLTLVTSFITFTSRDYRIAGITISTRPHLGLDIQGGLRVILEPKVALWQKQNPGKTWGAAQLSQVRQVIENRVNGTGVAEPIVQTVPADNEIIVELPGVRNRAQAISDLKSTANLQFFLLPQLGNAKTGNTGSWSLVQQTDPKTKMKQEVLIDKATGQPVTPEELQQEVFDNPALLVASGKDLEPNCQVLPDPTNNNQPVISFQLKSEAAQNFAQVTRANIGDYLAIFLDQKLITAPTINDMIDGSGQISGNFTVATANALKDQLNAGALPVPLKLLETRNLQATLGRDSVRTTAIAGGVALVLVLFFMFYFYRVPGLLADVALCLYTIFSFAVFKIYPVTLTLPGIAGFILSIGMAVDANILIFERLREELKSGKPLRAAIDNGFKRAFTAILDSNVCTAITCMVLYHFGSGPIKGFALTLGLGVAISMFTAIIVTRTFLFALANMGWAQNPKFYGLNVRVYNLKVMKRKWLWIGISLVYIIPGLIFWALGGIKTSIDFQGGTELTISYAKYHPASELQKELDSVSSRYRDSRVVLSEAPYAAVNKHLAIITTPALTDAQRIAVLDALTHNGADLVPGQQLQNVEYANVSGTISKQLTLGAIYAVIVASVLIVFYLAVRFSMGGLALGFRYGLCAVAALVHDVAVVWGSFAILGKLLNWQIDSLFVTAMLTVIGFSVHDTIIIFDRLRENMQQRVKGETFSDLADRSINQTFSRSLKTSATVLLVLTMLVIFGSNEIQHFAVALWIGILSGTYSSIFNATVLLVIWMRKEGTALPIVASASPGTSLAKQSNISVPGDRAIVTLSAAEKEQAERKTEQENEEAAARRSVRKQPARRRRM